MAGDPVKRIDRATEQGREYVARDDIAEATARTIPNAEHKLEKALSELAGAAGSLLTDGVPPHEPPAPTLAKHLPDLAARGLLTERERVRASAERAERLAAEIGRMLGAGRA